MSVPGNSVKHVQDGQEDQHSSPSSPVGVRRETPLFFEHYPAMHANSVVTTTMKITRTEMHILL